MTDITAGQLARLIEFPLHRPDATTAELEQHCTIARERKFAAVAVNPSYVEHARHFLDGSEVKVVAVIGFPLGGTDTETKRYETEVAVDNGAQEIAVVMNVGRFKSGENAYVLRELRDVAEAADERTVKVIIESGMLSDDEKRRACQLILDSGAQFVRPATGWSPYVVTADEIQLLREAVGPTFGVHACGNIRSFATATALLEAGANGLTILSAPEVIESARPSAESN